MPIKTLINKTISLLKRGLAESVICASEYNTVTKELSKLKFWAYPDLTTEDMVAVVRCKDCRYYKKYKKKDTFKPEVVYACSRTKLKRSKEFFCADGESK